MTRKTLTWPQAAGIVARARANLFWVEEPDASPDRSDEVRQYARDLFRDVMLTNGVDAATTAHALRVFDQAFSKRLEKLSGGSRS